MDFNMSQPVVLSFSLGEARLVQGPKGEDGKNAYDYAVENGFTGTEAAFGAMMASVPEHAASAEAAQLAAESAQSDAETARDDALTAKTAAETAKDDAQTAKSDAEDAASAAAGFAGSAAAAAAGAAAEVETRLAGYVSDAQSAKGDAETAQSAAEDAQTAAALSASSASGSASSAASSATSAGASAAIALDRAALAESWAVGGTGTRAGENTDNAKYWAQQARQVVGGDYATQEALEEHNEAGDAHQDIRTSLQNKVNNATFAAHTGNAASHVSAEDRAKWDASAARSVSGTLLSNGWSGAGPYTQSVAVEGVTAGSVLAVGVAANASAAQREAARGAMLSCTSQSAGAVAITADGELPAVDIPVTVIILA